MCPSDSPVAGEKFENLFRAVYFYFILTFSFDKIECKYHKINYVLGLTLIFL